MASIILYPHNHPDLMPGTSPFLCLPTHGYLQEELHYHKPGPPGAVKEGTSWYHNHSGGFRRPSHTLLPKTWKWRFQGPYCLVQEMGEEKPQPFQWEMQPSRFILHQLLQTWVIWHNFQGAQKGPDSFLNSLSLILMPFFFFWNIPAWLSFLEVVGYNRKNAGWRLPLNQLLS